MQITAKIDTSLLTATTYRAQKNLAWSVVQGVNATAKMIQQEQRDRLSDRFQLRTSATAEFLKRQAAVIRPFASVGQSRLYAEIAVGQKKNLLLAGYETGEDRRPVKGRLIAQPVTGNAARPSFSDPVAAQFQFRQMALKARQTAGGERQYKGRGGTFSIQGSGVFLRTGPRRQDIELLYAYAERQRLPRKLGWEQTARRVATQWLNENITRAYLRSLR